MHRHLRDLRVVATPSPPLIQNPLAVEKQSVAAEDEELPIAIRIPWRGPEESDDLQPDDDDRPRRPLPRRSSTVLDHSNIMIWFRIRGSVMGYYG